MNLKAQKLYSKIVDAKADYQDPWHVYLIVQSTLDEYNHLNDDWYIELQDIWDRVGRVYALDPQSNPPVFETLTMLLTSLAQRI